MTDGVFTRIIGGLGNQMFQYAAGRSLARTLGVPLKLDLSGFGTYKLWDYQLDAFPIHATPATAAELSHFAPPPPAEGGRLARLRHRIVRRLPAPARQSIVHEPGFHFTPSLFEARPPVLLDGYWQSPRYFEGIRDELLETFRPRVPLSAEASALHQRIAGDPGAVSVHVRRGDYCSNPAAAQVHGQCSLDYYRRAVALISRAVAKPTFYLFSDDVAFVAEAFDFCADRVIVDGGGRPAYEDMMLMRACRHNIIANSSYSWWAAWLNESADRIVVAPRRWFTEERLRATFTFDLYPNDWLTLG